MVSASAKCFSWQVLQVGTGATCRAQALEQMFGQEPGGFSTAQPYEDSL
jgi:hypothetical protein